MSPERWQQIAQLFDEVLERGPDERAAYLAEASAGDAELCREVESLLAARDSAGRFLDQSALELEARQLAAQPPTITIGQQIAHFEVLAPLGAGAMGEVFLARDTRLDRKVALKLLPLRFTQDPSRLRRFAREARAASALSHPNIITVYEIGQDGPRHYIAAEYVEGTTLRQHLKNGPLDIPTALDIATQIAAALEAAHQTGIVHRDIKPENVMVRPDGVVKVLDFGIAKLTEKGGTDSGGLPPQHSTEQGTVIGTPGYMSPEQARGLEVDARTDIFSLGVVLYEMVAGQVPFRGTTSADVIVALLERQPTPLSTVIATIPEEVEQCVDKLLAKKRTQRYQSAGELLRVLSELKTRRQPTYQGASRFTEKKLRSRVLRSKYLMGIFTALLFFLIVFLLRGYYQNWQDRRAWGTRANLVTTEIVSTRVSYRGEISTGMVSPDGQQIAYHKSTDGRSQIYVRKINGEAETLLTDGPWFDLSPVWSPDGRRIAFIRSSNNERAIWAITVAGGQADLLMMLSGDNPRLVDWKKNGLSEWVYYEAHHNLFAFDLKLKHQFSLTSFDPDSSSVRYFSIAPDQQSIAYLETKSNQNELMVQPLATPSTASVLVSDISSVSAPAWFSSGDKIAFLAERAGAFNIFIVWLANRAVEQVTFEDRNYNSLHVAPDDKTIMVVSARDNANIYALDLEQQTEVAHTSEFGVQVLPEFSPDNRQMIFQSTTTVRRGKEAIYLKPNLPRASAEKLASEGFNARWSPQGDAVSFLRFVPGQTDLVLLNLRQHTEQILQQDVAFSGFLPAPFNLSFPDVAWLPDGSRLVYQAKRAGLNNLWQVARDGSQNLQLTDNTAPAARLFSPVWSPDGQRLLYLLVEPKIAGGPLTYYLCLQEGGKSRKLYESPHQLKIVGWAASGSEALFLESQQNLPEPIHELDLMRYSLQNNRSVEQLTEFRRTYPTSAKLSPNGQRLAVVARQNGYDNVVLFDLQKGSSRQITDNRDSELLLGSLNWSADNRQLYFSKQLQYRFIARIAQKKS